jgi:hypothetical protein
MESHTASGGHGVAGGIPEESAIIPTRTSSCSASSVPTIRIRESRVGKIPTTRVRRLTSLCSRSIGFVE